MNLDGTLRAGPGGQGTPASTRFLFASSCSLYGAAGSAAVAEDAELFPVTPVRRDQGRWPSASCPLLADDNFSPTYLRNATAYGVSPRLRLDIVVNNLTAVAMTTGEVRLESDGSPWRPLVHIEDISRAFLAVLEAPRELDPRPGVQRRPAGGQRAGPRHRRDGQATRCPDSTLSFADGAGPDLRNYRVDFAKLDDTFPDLKLRWTGAAPGSSELAAAYAEHGLTYDDFQSVAVRPAAPDPASCCPPACSTR